jgi:hypothetical protein
MTDIINPIIELFSTSILNLYYSELYISADTEFKNNKVIKSLTDIYKHKCLAMLTVFTEKTQENQVAQSNIYKSVLNYCASKLTDPNNKGCYSVDLSDSLKNVSRGIISVIVKEFIPPTYHKMLNDRIEQDCFRIIMVKTINKCNIFIYTGKNISYIIDNRNNYSIEFLQDQFYQNVTAVKNSVAIDILNKNKKLSCDKSDIIKKLITDIAVLQTENEKLKLTIRYLMTERKSTQLLPQKLTQPNPFTSQPQTPLQQHQPQLQQQQPQRQQQQQQQQQKMIDEKYIKPNTETFESLVDQYLAPTEKMPEIKVQQPPTPKPQPPQYTQSSAAISQPTPTPTPQYTQTSAAISQPTSQYTQTSAAISQPTPTPTPQNTQTSAAIPKPTPVPQPQPPKPEVKQESKYFDTKSSIDDSLFEEVLGDPDFVEDDFDEKEPVDEKPKQELPKPENKTDVQDDVDYI